LIFCGLLFATGEKKSWIAIRENENSLHRSVNNENKSHAMPVCENPVATFIRQQIVFKLDRSTLSLILHTFSTRRLKFLPPLILRMYRTGVLKSSAINGKRGLIFFYIIFLL